MASSPEGSFVLLLAGNGAAFLYSAIDDDFVSGRQVIPTPIQGYYGPVAAGPNGQYYLVNDQVLNQALTPIGEPSGITGPVSGGTLPAPNPTAAARPVSAVAALGARSFARFSMPLRASAAAVTADAGVIEVVDAASQRTTAAANSLEGPLAAVAAGGRANMAGRTMVADPSGSTVYVLTASGLSIIPVPAPGSQNVPQLPANGVVSTASYQPSVAPGGLISIFGRNLAGNATAFSGAPLPYILGATCVTLNNTPLPLLASSAAQINAQLPPTLVAGRYSLVVRSIAAQEASGAASVAVSRYAPAVFVDEQGAAIFHQDGTRVARDRPAKRDEPLTIYATGLGTTTGGRVTAGSPAPSSPLAVTAPVQVFFGNPSIKEAGVIVDWSGLLPGAIGVYQINCRVPGAHLRGDALPVTLRIGAVNSPTTGVTAPTVSVR